MRRLPGRLPFAALMLALALLMCLDARAESVSEGISQALGTLDLDGLGNAVTDSEWFQGDAASLLKELAGGKAVGQATGFVNAQALLILETFWDWLDGTSPEWELGNLIRRKN